MLKFLLHRDTEIGTRAVFAYRTLIRIFVLTSLTAAIAAAQDNLPVFTSPIDITGFPVQFHAVAPDRNTGQPVDVAAPVGLLGPKMSAFFTTPLSAQIDRYWSVTPDPKTGKTPQQLACDGPSGIVAQVQTAVHKIGSSFSAYDISCNLASTGKLLAQQNGAVLTIAYLLTGNKVDFKATTPATCHAGHGTPLCPNDPGFSVTFATELITAIRTPALCQLTADNGTALTQSVEIQGSQNLAGSLASLADDLFLGHRFSGAERAIENTQTQVPLPLDADFQELRGGDACTGKNALLSRTLKEFRDFQVVIQSRPSALAFRMTHPAIAPLTLQVPNPAAAPAPAPQPGFIRPTIATNRPSVAPGGSVEVDGSFFPPNPNLATTLPVTFVRNLSVLGGPCFGGATQLRWGPATAPNPVQALPAAAPSNTCANVFSANNLTPSTAYQFAARDCDAITCSLWSPTVRATTAAANSTRGNVALTLDGVSPLGSGQITAQGTFAATVTLPSNVLPGTHKIRAVNGSIVAETALAVVAANPNGTASIVMVGVLPGESGCPNHPISSTQTGSTFMLFGSGFAAGQVAIRLDTTAGMLLGTASAQGDGSFCQRMNGVPAANAGNHTLLAIENGAVAAQKPATFVLPTVVH